MYIGHNCGFYKISECISAKYFYIPSMIYSAGGGCCAKTDLTEFWWSANTDPVERCFIQWCFSQFFPCILVWTHATGWNKKSSIKFRTEAACVKIGFDIGLKNITVDGIKYVQQDVANWNKNNDAILEGDKYRLIIH